jgi:phage terminase small subunit
MSAKSDKELTDKQRRFCEEYIIDWNATRAAKAAGYSEKTAYSIGSANLKKVEIQDYIKYIQKDLQKQAGLSALRNLLELKKLAYTNLSDFKEDWTKFKDFSELTEEQRAAISEISHSETTFGEDGHKVSYKIKLHDKMKAIDMINKMLGFDSGESEEDNNNHKGNLVINIGNGKVDLPSSEDAIQDFTDEQPKDDK